MSIQLILEQITGVKFEKYGFFNSETSIELHRCLGRDYKNHVSSHDLKTLKRKYHEFLLKEENDMQLGEALTYLGRELYDS